MASNHCREHGLLQPQPKATNEFENKLISAFGELLEDANLCDSYAGDKTTNAGDGLLCLPQMIHQGPGNPSSCSRSRYVLFFSLRPTYNNTTCQVVKYDSSRQIHASYILFQQLERAKKMYEKVGCGMEQFVSEVKTMK